VFGLQAGELGLHLAQAIAGIAAISRGDTDSLRSVWAGAARSFTNFLGR
jgi:hypothetical protein